MILKFSFNFWMLDRWTSKKIAMFWALGEICWSHRFSMSNLRIGRNLKTFKTKTLCWTNSSTLSKNKKSQKFLEDIFLSVTTNIDLNFHLASPLKFRGFSQQVFKSKTQSKASRGERKRIILKWSQFLPCQWGHPSWTLSRLKLFWGCRRRFHNKWSF